MDRDADRDDVHITNVPVKLSDNPQPAQYANHISVNGTADLVQIDFAQILRPIIESDEQRRALADPGIPGHVISRILLPEDVFRRFILGIAAQIAESEEE